jgi:hypothetical protein
MNISQKTGGFYLHRLSFFVQFDGHRRGGMQVEQKNLKLFMQYTYGLIQIKQLIYQTVKFDG